jgi:hypothetical protein
MLIIFTAWIPGQGVKVDYPAIVEILIQQLIEERQSKIYPFVFLIEA